MVKLAAFIHKKAEHASVFFKFMVLIETVMFIATGIVAILVSYMFTGIIREKEIVLGNTNLERVAAYMREKYERVESIANSMNDNYISNIMTDIYENPQNVYDYENISHVNVFFSGINAADPDFSDIILISLNGESYSYTPKPYANVNTSYQFMESKRVRQFLQSEEHIDIFRSDPTEYCLKEREDVVSFMGRIYDASLLPQKKVTGIYIMNIPVDILLEKALTEDTQMKGTIILSNHTGEMLFGYSQGEFYGKESENGKTAYSAEEELFNSGVEAQYILPENELLEESTRLNIKIALLLGMELILSAVICHRIGRIYRQRVQRLLDAMNNVEKGEFNDYVPVESKDELGVIGNSFNHMCQQLHDYIERVYAAEIQRKNAELNSLQMQINPHFLYNTLESIKAKAISVNDEETAEMIALLGNLFRWSCRTDEKIVILDEELEYVKTYLKLQSFRYEHEMEICIQVEEEYLDCAVPKLILQPIIENVIKHAFRWVERPCLAGITVKKKENNLEITVYDNGCGIEKEKLEKLRKNLEEDVGQDEFDSIGIQNVHHRLRLLFGQGYGLQIASIFEKGTAVKAVLPAMDKEEMIKRVQDSDNGR